MSVVKPSFVTLFFLVVIIILFSANLVSTLKLIEINNNPNLILDQKSKEYVNFDSNLTKDWEPRDYYGVEYSEYVGGAELKISHEINDSCIEVRPYHGGSMKPCFGYSGLSIVDVCFPKEELVIGDTIVFYNVEGETIQHRIIRINYEGEWVITRGDANYIEDDPIGFDDIIGKSIGMLNIRP